MRPVAPAIPSPYVNGQLEFEWGQKPMTTDWIIGKFLDDEALLEGGNAAVHAVVTELGNEGVTVLAATVSSVQRVMRRVVALQRERVAANA